MASHHHHHHHDQPVDNDPTPPPTTSPGSPTPPAADAPAFSDLGVTFNDATRSLVGGLWQNVVEEGGQGNGSIVKYTDDLTTVQTGLSGGSQRRAILRRHADPCQTDPGRHYDGVVGGNGLGERRRNVRQRRGGRNGAAQQPSRHSQYRQQRSHSRRPGDAERRDRISRRHPPPLPDGTTAANAPHANLAEIGAIFNDAANHILGGVNADNAGSDHQRRQRRHHRHAGPDAANPTLFGGLDRRPCGHRRAAAPAREHLHQPGRHQSGCRDAPATTISSTSSTSCRATPIWRTWQTRAASPALRRSAISLNPTPKYMDNDAQTNFWANFIAQSNSLGQQAEAAVAANDPAGDLAR